MAIAFDTLQAKETFTEAGFPEKEAKALVHVMARKDEGLATKDDMALLQDEIEDMGMHVTNRIYTIGLSIGALVVSMNALY